MSSSVEQIKENLSIVDVISSYIKVEKAGSNLKARCPFHNEKTPSFFISPTRNTFYCFGCGEKGDIFTFVERFEGLDFQGALRVLGEKAGVPIVYENKAKKDERDSIYKVLEETTSFFESNLDSNKETIKYLKDRGLKDEYIKRFRIGYAKPEWDSLYNHLIERGFVDKDIERAGLIKKSARANEGGVDRGYYDRLRSRIIFPISDSSGRVIAFSGRIFPNDDGAAKYINSPETELFNKSKTLYGFDKAKIAIRKSNFSIVVEGQMDLVMSHQSGFPNTVALSGTALTIDHVNILGRMSKNIVFAFDADTAGIASSGRGAEIALSAGMDVKIARIPKGTDPADLAKSGVDNLKKAIRESQHIVDFYLDTLEESETDRLALGRKIEQIVLPFVARIPSKIDQMHFVTRVAGRLGVDNSVILEEVSKVPISSTQVVQVEKQPQENSESFIVKKNRKDALREKLFGILFWQEESKDKLIDVNLLKERLSKVIGEDEFKEKLNNRKEFEEDVLFLTEVGYANTELAERDVTELLIWLEKEYLKEDFETVLVELRRAEQQKDEKLVEIKLKECKNISDKIDSLKIKDIE